MDYQVVKALHIIFVVSWFAGLFYIVRLFIYHVEALDLKENIAAVRAVGFLGDRKVETFGTATPKNNTNAHVLEMAEKRARARAVLMLAGFYAQGIFGEGENIQDDGE